MQKQNMLCTSKTNRPLCRNAGTFETEMPGFEIGEFSYRIVPLSGYPNIIPPKFFSEHPGQLASALSICLLLNFESNTFLAFIKNLLMLLNINCCLWTLRFLPPLSHFRFVVRYKYSDQEVLIVTPKISNSSFVSRASRTQDSLVTFVEIKFDPSRRYLPAQKSQYLQDLFSYPSII